MTIEFFSLQPRQKRRLWQGSSASLELTFSQRVLNSVSNPALTAKVKPISRNKGWWERKSEKYIERERKRSRKRSKFSVKSSSCETRKRCHFALEKRAASAHAYVAQSHANRDCCRFASCFQATRVGTAEEVTMHRQHGTPFALCT